MQKAHAEDPRQWGLIRVAIVGLQNDVFVGRLFFGNLLTGRVCWDCDCRPSDGCFLSIKVRLPTNDCRDVDDMNRHSSLLSSLSAMHRCTSTQPCGTLRPSLSRTLLCIRCCLRTRRSVSRCPSSINKTRGPIKQLWLLSRSMCRPWLLLLRTASCPSMTISN